MEVEISEEELELLKYLYLYDKGAKTVGPVGTYQLPTDSLCWKYQECVTKEYTTGIFPLDIKRLQFSLGRWRYRYVQEPIKLVLPLENNKLIFVDTIISITPKGIREVAMIAENEIIKKLDAACKWPGVRIKVGEVLEAYANHMPGADANNCCKWDFVESLQHIAMLYTKIIEHIKSERYLSNIKSSFKELDLPDEYFLDSPDKDRLLQHAIGKVSIYRIMLIEIVSKYRETLLNELELGGETAATVTVSLGFPPFISIGFTEVKKGETISSGGKKKVTLAAGKE